MSKPYSYKHFHSHSKPSVITKENLEKQIALELEKLNDINKKGKFTSEQYNEIKTSIENLTNALHYLLPPNESDIPAIRKAKHNKTVRFHSGVKEDRISPPMDKRSSSSTRKSKSKRKSKSTKSNPRPISSLEKVILTPSPKKGVYNSIRSYMGLGL